MLRILAGLVAAVALAGGVYVALQRERAQGYQAGWDARETKAQATDAAAARAQLRGFQDGAALAARVGAEHANAVRIIEVGARALAVEIPKHVTPEIDRRYPLPVGLVRVHDAAVAGLDVSAVADPLGRPDDAASSVAASDAGQVLNDNYAGCRADQDALRKWQEIGRAWGTSAAAPPY